MEKQSHPKGSGFGGEYTRLPQVMREKLNKAMPAESIGKHPSASYLSTIKSIYVTERLNDVFGTGGWDLETEIVKEERLIHMVRGAEVEYDHVIVCGRLYFREFDLYGPIQFGGHDDKSLMAVNAYKGAITDCLSKCASLLEIGIQVFKGNPDDRNPGNKSKRVDEHAEKKTPVVSEETKKEFLEKDDDANPEGMRKPSVEESEEPIVLEEEPKVKTEEELAADAELAGLQAKHKFLFGRKPNANVKVENLRAKIEKEEAKRREEKALEEAVQEQKKEEAPATPFAEEVKEEEPEEVKAEIVDLAFLKAKVDEYTSADALGEDAKEIDTTAGDANFSEEDRSELRNYINAKYTKLNK